MVNMRHIPNSLSGIGRKYFKSRDIVQPLPALAIVSMVVFSGFIIISSRATTPAISVEPEKGTLSGVRTVDDPAASGGQGIKFGVQQTVSMTEFAFGATTAYIKSLPTSGAEWDRLKRQADAPYDLLIGDGATDGSGNAFAGGLVYVRTGDIAYKNKVNAALDKVQASNPGGWWHAAANRKMIGWALAGQLVGREAKTSAGSYTAWGQFLRNQLTVTHGGPSKSGVMGEAAWSWDNNHGAAAMQSYAAICAVLGIKNETMNGHPGGLDPLYQWLKAWLGGTHSGFAYSGTNTNTSYGTMGATDTQYSLTWQFAGKHAGLVPSSAWAGTSVDAKRAGAIPSDVIRDGGAYPNPGGSAKHYVPGNGGRRTMAAVILAANGHPDIWQYADKGLLRWRQWMVTNNMPIEGSNNMAYDSVLNAVYGTNFPSKADKSEGITSADWLALGGKWPIR